MVKEFYFTDRWDPKRILQLRVRVDLGVKAMKRSPHSPKF